MTKVTLDDILRLQSNLKSIRAVLGWSAENLADCLAVSRATISYLENRRQDMSTVQYLAIKAVINEELNNADRFQRRTVDILLGKYEMRDFSSERLKEILGAIEKRVGRRPGSKVLEAEIRKELSVIFGTNS